MLDLQAFVVQVCIGNFAVRAVTYPACIHSLYCMKDRHMLVDAYRVLLEAFARRLQGVDCALFIRTQSLKIGGLRIDFSVQRDRHDRAQDRVVLRCDVMRLPVAASDGLCRQLLRANNLWAGTYGATLGLRGDDVVILSISARIGSVDDALLESLVRDLCRQAWRWAEELSTPTDLSPPMAAAMASLLRA